MADLVGPREGRRRLDPCRALSIGAEAARGLHVLHEHGVVHRDVKPGNLLLTTRDGSDHVVIADLGMAKALAESSGLTLTAGTPAYMAPEQAHGAKGFDERADVYAAAAVTYALLTGRPPYAVRRRGWPPEHRHARPQADAGTRGRPRENSAGAR